MRCSQEGCGGEFSTAPENATKIQTSKEGRSAVFLCGVCLTPHWSSGIEAKVAPYKPCLSQQGSESSAT